MRKVLLAALLCVAASFSAVAQVSFYQAVRSLQQVGYVLDDAFCRGSAIRCQQTPQHFWYNQPRHLGWTADASIPAFQFVDAGSIRQIQVYTLKSQHKIIGLAGLAMLQKWYFKDAASASRAALILKKNNLYYEEHLHKGPWTFYQAGPDLYLVLTAGTRMRDELPKLTAALRQTTTL